jgi:hypothetical protein
MRLWGFFPVVESRGENFFLIIFCAVGRMKMPSLLSNHCHRFHFLSDCG